MAPAEAFLMEEEFGAGLLFTDFDPCFLDPWYALNKARAELFSAPPPASAAPAHSEQAQELDAREATILITRKGLLEPLVALLSKKSADSVLESELVDLLGYDDLPLLQAILQNRSEVHHNLVGALAPTTRPRPEHVPKPGTGISVTMESTKLAEKQRKKDLNKNKAFRDQEVWLSGLAEQATKQEEYSLTQQTLFRKSGDTMLGIASTLPPGAVRRDLPHYDEIFIPAVRATPPKGEKLIPISDFDDWAQLAFSGVTHLNRIQSKVFETAFRSNENMLICAPTGAGKTMIALMTMLNLIGQHLHGGIIRKEEFKVVYVAPMKALAAEMAENFHKRLAPYNLRVNEWTGDISLTKREIGETNVFVTTPEKWDAVTRKAPDDSLAKLVKLLIIDEVHLLHEDRGSVIEIIVARTLRLVESSQSMIRIVGLSATLPNFKDVAAFLGVNLQRGLFVFDSSYRPTPLDQVFIGVKEKKQSKQNEAYNQAVLDRCVTSLKAGHQVMVFVHSRKSTFTTSMQLMELARQRNLIEIFQPTIVDTWARKALERSQNRELKELAENGFGCHHAGMLRTDRTLCEKLFRLGQMRVLCCTATLAWGVNLPAHTVIIKGTDVYNSTRGGFQDLGILDVMQIFGRAGRPQYDDSGEGIIVTTNDKIDRYVRLLTHATPIESRFVESLADHLNAEIVLGTVSDIREAVQWLGYTYLYVRMRANPLHYGMTWQELADDPLLGGKREQLVRAACEVLDKNMMIRFDENTGLMSYTELGRIASHLYIQNGTMELFNEKLVDAMVDQQILALLAECHEFNNLQVREDEQNELEELQRAAIIPVTGGEHERHRKINILMQVFIGQVHLTSFSLISDTNYINQSAGRLCRALFEISLQRNWASNVLSFLRYCISIERRCWFFNHPLRQFNVLPDEIIRKMETRKVSMARLQELDSLEIGKLITNMRYGPIIKQLAMQFPTFNLDASCQPITRQILRVKLSIEPTFEWSDGIHGGAQSFWIFVEDTDTQTLHHHENFLLTRKIAQRQEIQQVNFTIPLSEPVPNQYLIRVVSEKFFGAEETVPLSFQHLILPLTYPPYTELLPLHPLPTTALNSHEFMKLYRFSHFNPIQTQVFHHMYHTDLNALIGAPTGSGKTITAELAALRAFALYPGQKVIYIAPLKALVKERVEDWTRRFEGILGYRVVELTGDAQPDIALLNSADILCTTPEKWDGISRNWQNRGYVRDVALLIIDEIHLLGNDRGPILEVIVSRMRYIGWHVNRTIRLVGLSTALSNARDLADWMGIEGRGLYNFRPSVRPVPVEVHIAGFPGKHYCPRMATMNKPAYNAIMQHSPAKPVLIFVSSRRQTRLTALDLINFLAADQREKMFVRMSDDDLDMVLEQVSDQHLRHTLNFGIGLHHAGICKEDKAIVEKLFFSERIQVLVATSTLAWGVNFPAHLVIVKGTEFYDGKTKTYVDYPITDVLQMMGRAGRPQFDKDAKAVVLVHEPKKGFYKKFLYDPFPVESSLHNALHEHLNAEIVAGTISKRQDAIDYLTWTYLFRRILQNPTYYGVENITHESITIYLSRLVEQVLRDLQATGCIEDASTDELIPTTIGRIASYYYLSHQSASLYEREIREDVDMPTLLRLLSEAEEYSELPVRHNEDKLNAELARDVPWPVDARNIDDPHVKANLLFQAHFSRCRLPISDYITDTKSVLDNAIRVIQAMVDITANNGFLKAALRCMALLQMVMQGRWHHDNSLLQLPHLTKQHLPLLAAKGLPSLPHLLHCNRRKASAALASLFPDAPDEELFDILSEILDAANHFPRIDVRLTTEIAYPEEEDAEEEGEPLPQVTLNIDLLRRSRYYPRIYAPRFTKPKDEGWWVVIGDQQRNELVAVKRINAVRRLTSTKLVFDWDEEMYGPGMDPTQPDGYRFTFFLISDCYMAVDQEYEFVVRHRDLPPPPAPRHPVAAAGGEGEDGPAETEEEEEEELEED